MAIYNGHVSCMLLWEVDCLFIDSAWLTCPHYDYDCKAIRSITQSSIGIKSCAYVCPQAPPNIEKLGGAWDNVVSNVMILSCPTPESRRRRFKTALTQAKQHTICHKWSQNIHNVMYIIMAPRVQLICYLCQIHILWEAVWQYPQSPILTILVYKLAYL